MAPIHHFSIAELHAAYASRALTPRAVTEHYLARIDAFDPALNAYIEVDRARALAAADRVTGGPLHGVPVAVKSNIAVAGLELNAGMEARRGIIAPADAEAVRRLRQAGAIILGTLNMHEAALGATTDNPFFGPTYNPHGQKRTPGGSSGGSGAAVAAGLCVAALGTDTLGSIRIPAAYNGVYGIKPTNGAIADDGVVPVSKALDSVGPLARSLDDLEAVLQALGVATAPGPIPDHVAIIETLGSVKVEAAVAQAYERARRVMPTARFDIATGFTRLRLAGFVVATRELATHIAALDPSKFSPWLRFLLDYAAQRSPADFADDQAMCAQAAEQMRTIVAEHGAILLPTAPHAAFVQGTNVPHTQADFTGLANLAGLPAISIPAGTDADGMPVAIQLIGRAGAEGSLLALARIFDTALSGYARPPGF